MPCGKCIDESRESCPDCEETVPSSQGGGCVCGSDTKRKTLINCTVCARKWHSACVGLDGLTQSVTAKIVGWKCPICFRFSPELRAKLEPSELEESLAGGGDVAQGVKEEVKKQIGEFIPEIVEKVVGGVRAALNEPEAFKDASQKITQTWADIAKKEQKSLITDVVEKTSETALKKSISLIDANLTEQRKRTRNCVISGIPENYNRGRDTETSLGEVVLEFLNEENLELNDLVSCKRLGEKKAGHNRFILVVFKSEQDAMYFHNYGRGRNLKEGVWCNPDLTKTERDALFEKRKQRRERKSGGAEQQNSSDHRRENDTVAASPVRGGRRGPPPPYQRRDTRSRSTSVQSNHV